MGRRMRRRLRARPPVDVASLRRDLTLLTLSWENTLEALVDLEEAPPGRRVFDERARSVGFALQDTAALDERLRRAVEDAAVALDPVGGEARRQRAERTLRPRRGRRPQAAPRARAA